MINEKNLPYKSREIEIQVGGDDEVLFNITKGRKFRITSLKILNPVGAASTVILKDDTITKETILVAATSTLYIPEDELKGIEFEGNQIIANAEDPKVIIRIGGLEY